MWLLNDSFFFVGVARQQQALVPSPARKRDKRPSISNSQEESSQKARWDRRPNWSLNEMIVLVDAQRNEFLEELVAIDGRDLMDSEVTKWNRISEKITASGFSTHFRDDMTCKDK
jgi:hypothetical protein